VTADLLDGAHDQRERLISTAGEGMGGPESRGDNRRPGNELPHAGEIEAPLEYTCRVWKIAALEVGQAQIEQSEV
jgi:hypothetical protein